MLQKRPFRFNRFRSACLCCCLLAVAASCGCRETAPTPPEPTVEAVEYFDETKFAVSDDARVEEMAAVLDRDFAERSSEAVAAAFDNEAYICLFIEKTRKTQKKPTYRMSLETYEELKEEYGGDFFAKFRESDFQPFLNNLDSCKFSHIETYFGFKTIVFSCRSKNGTAAEIKIPAVLNADNELKIAGVDLEIVR